MALLKDIWEKIKNRGQDGEPQEEIPDDVTRDNYLRSLRREDRTLDEEEEKEFLKKKIANRKREKLRVHLFGIKKEVKKKQLINALNKKKEIKILSSGHDILKEKKKKINQSHGFLEKYKL